VVVGDAVLVRGSGEVVIPAHQTLLCYLCSRELWLLRVDERPI
jgi:hypothetical protein